MNPVPSIPMLSSGGSGKVLMVIGVLVAIALVANQQQKTTTPATN